MLLTINGADVSALTTQVTCSCSKNSCARTLSASIARPVADALISVPELRTGMEVQFSSDGFDFFGVLSSIATSTESDTADIKAYDPGLYMNKNSTTQKIRNMTPAAAAKTVCARFGVPVGYLEGCGGFTFSRNFVNTTLYQAVMTGYTFAAEKTGKKYQMRMIGSKMCVIERGGIVAGVVNPGQNLMLASYSEDMERMINRVDMYDGNGNFVSSVSGDTSFGIMAKSVTLSERIDRAYAEKLLRDNKLARTGTVQLIGNPDCITGNAVLVYEPHTGLYGKFYIDSDTHSWKNGIYTTKITVNYENIMDETEAGSELTKSAGKKNSVKKEASDAAKPRSHYGPDGSLIYTYPTDEAGDENSDTEEGETKPHTHYGPNGSLIYTYPAP